MNRGTVHAPTLHLVSSHTTPEHPARIIGTLIAMRCPDCLLDTVVDLTTPDADVWILDESDYHDTGSHDPQETE